MTTRSINVSGDWAIQSWGTGDWCAASDLTSDDADTLDRAIVDRFESIALEHGIAISWVHQTNEIIYDITDAEKLDALDDDALDQWRDEARAWATANVNTVLGLRVSAYDSWMTQHVDRWTAARDAMHDETGAPRDDVPPYIFDLLASISALQQAFTAARNEPSA